MEHREIYTKKRELRSQQRATCCDQSIHIATFKMDALRAAAARRTSASRGRALGNNKRVGPGPVRHERRTHTKRESDPKTPSTKHNQRRTTSPPQVPTTIHRDDSVVIDGIEDLQLDMALRAAREPRMLFGESDSARRVRLERAQRRLRGATSAATSGGDNHNDGTEHGQRNDFGLFVRDTDTKVQEDLLRRDWVGANTIATLHADLARARAGLCTVVSSTTTDRNESLTTGIDGNNANGDDDNEDDDMSDPIATDIIQRIAIRVGTTATRLVAIASDRNRRHVPYPHPVFDDPLFMLSADQVANTNSIIESPVPTKKNDNSDDSDDALVTRVRRTCDTRLLSQALLASDPKRARELAVIFVRRVLRCWRKQLSEDLLAIQRGSKSLSSTYNNNQSQGSLLASVKLRIATQRQSEANIAPLLKLLLEGGLAAEVLQKLVNIFELASQREYMLANDTYLQLAIGNAPWPIGVTMVGIHERSARERISSSQVGHVLNDENQRKWIQTIKRLLTFAQNSWPPDDLAKMVG